jgi:hypothetical protein
MLNKIEVKSKVSIFEIFIDVIRFIDPIKFVYPN